MDNDNGVLGKDWKYWGDCIVEKLRISEDFVYGIARDNYQINKSSN